MNNNSKGILFASLTAVLWGVLAILIKFTLNKIDTATISWVRFLIAFGILFIYVVSTQRRKLKIFLSPPFLLIISAVCLTLNYVGFTGGIDYTSPGNAQIYIQLGPVLLAMAGIFIFKEKFNKIQMFGFLLVLAGQTLFYFDQHKVTNIDSSDYLIGVLLVLMAALSWTCFSVFQKKLVKKYSVTELNLVIYFLPIVLLFWFIDLSPINSLSTAHWIILIFMGVNTLLAYTFLSLALKYTDATKVGIIITLNPILTFVIIFALREFFITIFIEETISVRGIIGAVIALAGAIITIVWSKKNIKSKINA